jgi:effector-binding domain-containing protein
MPQAFRFTAILACLISLYSCGDAATAPAEQEEILSTSIEGGDTSVQVMQLDYQDLDLPERHYLVFRQELSLLDMNGFLGMESEALSVAATKAGIPATGPMTTLTYAWDVDRGWGDAAVALPVAAGTKLPPYVTITLPATKAIALDFKGTYEALSAMHYSLNEELNRRALKPVLPSIEEYTVGPLQVQDPNEFQTRLIYSYSTPAQ